MQRWYGFIPSFHGLKSVYLWIEHKTPLHHEITIAELRMLPETCHRNGYTIVRPNMTLSLSSQQHWSQPSINARKMSPHYSLGIVRVLCCCRSVTDARSHTTALRAHVFRWLVAMVPGLSFTRNSWNPRGEQPLLSFRGFILLPYFLKTFALFAPPFIPCFTWGTQIWLVSYRNAGLLKWGKVGWNVV